MKKTKSVKLLMLFIFSLFFFSGCNDKKDLSSELSNEQADRFECEIIDKFSDVIPTSVNHISNSDEIVLNGYCYESNSDVYIRSADDQLNSVFEENFPGRKIIDMQYSEKYEDNLYFIFQNDNGKCSFVEYNIIEKKETEITDSDYFKNMKLNIDSEGNVYAVSYTVNEDSISFKELIKYVPDTGKKIKLDFSKYNEFSCSDYIPVSFKKIDSLGYLWLIYDNDSRMFYFKLYNEDMKLKYTIESQDNRIYSAMTYYNFCISNAKDLLIFTHSDNDVIDIDCYDLEKGKYKNSSSLMKEEISEIMDGSEEYSYYFTDEHNIYGVQGNGEINQLCSTNGIVSDWYNKDGNVFYLVFYNRDDRDISFLLDSSLETVKETDIKNPENKCIETILYDKNGSSYAVLRDDNFKVYFVNLSEKEYSENIIFSNTSLSSECINMDNDYLYAILWDFSETYKVSKIDLKNNFKETIFELDEVPSGTNFWYSNDSIYYMIENTDKNESTDIYRFDCTKGDKQKICSVKDKSLCFAEKSGKYEFCYYTNEGVYAYSDSKFIKIIDFKKIQSIPVIRDVFVIDDSHINIIGYDVDDKMNMYKFIGADSPHQDKAVLKVWENFNFEQSFTGSSGSRLQRLINKINSSNVSYRIEAEYFTASELNKKLFTEDAPDIILSSGHLDKAFSEYTVDLSDFVSEEINDKDFYSNVIELGRKDNSYYELIPEFMFNSFYGDKKYIGSDELWTIDDLIHNSENTKCQNVFYELSKMDLFDELIFRNLNSFINEDTGIISLNENRVGELLEFIQKYGCDDSDDSSYLTQNQSLLSFSSISSSGFINIPKYGEYDEPVFVGIPSSENKCIVIDPLFSAAILKSSDMQQYSMEFLKMILSDEFQNEAECIPVKRTSLDVQAKNNDFDSDSINKMKDLLDNHVVLSFINDELLDSLYESKIDYFNKKISTDQFLKIIENKIGMYLDETK